jgi:hypothetical protein
MKSIVVEQYADLAELAPGWTITSLTVGPFSEPLVQLSEKPPIDAPVDDQPLMVFRSLRILPSGIVTLELPAMRPLPTVVQPLPDQRWLVVCPFAERDNARVYDASGHLIRSFWIGKNVGDVQATEDGVFWTGWGDEGIFSDDLISQAGAGCFNEWGHMLFSFHGWLCGPPPLRSLLDPVTFAMNHCTALNVAANTGITLFFWAYRHNDALVRLAPDGTVHAWPHIPAGFAQAVAVDDRRALFAIEPETLQLVTLASLEMTTLQPVDEHGMPLQIAFPCARGGRLWFISGLGLYACDLNAV